MSKDYKIFKNHMHNTLGVTKDDVRAMTEAAIKETVERKIDVWFKDNMGSSQDMILLSIASAIRSKSIGYWFDSERRLDTDIKEAVVHHLVKNVKLKVEVATKAADATKVEMVRVVRHTEKGDK